LQEKLPRDLQASVQQACIAITRRKITPIQQSEFFQTCVDDKAQQERWRESSALLKHAFPAASKKSHQIPD
jgi:hypothetical protein